MTSPTDLPNTAPPAAPAPGHPDEAETALVLRRTLRTPNGETWDIAAGEGRVGTATLHYGDGVVEGLLALPSGLEADSVRGILGWVTDHLTLDAVAGPGGQIHWVVSNGALEDFWRRSPGRRASGAENDVAATRARVEPVLAAMFEGKVAATPDGGYAVDTGSARVFVNVRLAETLVLVRVFSITNVDVKLDTGLAPYLLGLNFSMALGRFSVDESQRAVWFDHVLTADDLDESTLARTVSTVGAVADKHDDEIKARFGGRTFREEGSPVDHVAAAGGGPGGGPGMAGGYL
jgi:hypothetical protein